MGCAVSLFLVRCLLFVFAIVNGVVPFGSSFDLFFRSFASFR